MNRFVSNFQARLFDALRAVAFSALLVGVSLWGNTPVWAAKKNPGQQIVPIRTERQLNERRAQRKKSIKSNTSLPDFRRPAAPGDRTPLFKLKGVDVEGATIFSAEVLSLAYRDFIGKRVSEADLIAIAQRLTKLYLDQGYGLSRAILPPQDVAQDHIRVKVLEGFIEEIVLKGEGAERFGARKLLANVRTKRPLKTSTLERYLLLVSDTPGIHIKDTALEEMPQGSGRFRLTVDLETWHIWLRGEIDNRGTSDIGPVQSNFSTSIHSPLYHGESVDIDVATIPESPRELTFGRLLVATPMGTNGVKLHAAASYSEIWPSGLNRTPKTHTVTDSYEFGASIAPLRTRRSSLWLNAAFVARNANEQNATRTVYRDRLRVMSVSADYQIEDQIGGANYLTVNVRQGLHQFGASREGDALLSRFDGTGKFTSVNAAFTRHQKFNEKWSLLFSAAGQIAGMPLLSSEEFYLGGQRFGRAFDSGALSGDSGIAASLEVRFEKKLNRKRIKTYQLYGYLDTGTVWNIDLGPDDEFSLSSAGAGVRAEMAHGFEATLEIASVVDSESFLGAVGDTRIFFSVAKSLRACPEKKRIFCAPE